jgi:hypothetical protein
MPHRVHAPMKRAQMQRFDPSGDRPPAHSPLQKLTTSNYAMLPIRELGDCEIRASAPRSPANRIFGTHTVLNIRFTAHCPIVAGFV